MVHEAQVSRVAARMPEFVATDPELYFSKVEGSFHSAGVTQDQMEFGYIGSALPAKYAA